MSGKMEKLRIDDEFYAMMRNKLEDEGWTSARHFTLGAKLPFSSETTRRVFVKCDYKSLEASTLATVMLFLNFTRTEIREALRTFTSDNIIWRLIGIEGDSASLTSEENAMLEMVRLVAEHDHTVFIVLAGILSSLAVAHHVDLSEQLKRVKRMDVKDRRKEK